MGIPQNGWFIMENPTKMDDLEYPYFRKPPNSCGKIVVCLLQSMKYGLNMIRLVLFIICFHCSLFDSTVLYI